MKKVLKPKTINHDQPLQKPTNEIVFRLKRPHDIQAFDFIYLQNQPKDNNPSLKKTKTNPENEQNEKNLYKIMQNLSLDPKPTTSKQLFSNKTYILKRVEETYVKKKQEEFIEKMSSQKRLEKIRENRVIPEMILEENKSELPEKIALIFEKYKKLEEEELKHCEKEPTKKNNKQSTTMYFYDLKYKNSQNQILFNDKPTEFNYLISESPKTTEKTFHEESKMETEEEKETTDYYVLAEIDSAFQMKPELDDMPKVDIDLNLLKAYHYDNVFDEFHNFVNERNEDSPKNEDSWDSNSENNPCNDYPDEPSSDEGNSKEKDSLASEDNENIESDEEDGSKEEIYLEEEQENEFYEKFKSKMDKAKPKEFLEDDNYDDF